MNLLLSVFFTVAVNQPVVLYGCCPIMNVLVWNVVPMLVIEKPVPIIPDQIARDRHVAAI